MMVIEFSEDKVGKAMRAISKINEYAECLSEVFKDATENRYGNRRYYNDDRYETRFL